MKPELNGIAKWGQDSGLSPDEFKDEVWNTVTALGSMMIDDHDRISGDECNTISISLDTNDDQYDYELAIHVRRTKKENKE